MFQNKKNQRKEVIYETENQKSESSKNKKTGHENKKKNL